MKYLLAFFLPILGTLGVMWQIVAGRTYRRGGGVFATRKANPGDYWFAVGTQAVLVAILWAALIYLTT